MPTRQLQGVLRYLRGAIVNRSAEHLPDSELLERFLTRRDEAAFELLVWRHHRLVFGVCSRILSDPDDVEDAFQASFLVLVRRAGSIRKRTSLSSWLHGVARRVALEATRRKPRRLPSEPQRPTSEPSDELVHRELRSIFDEELGSLPKKYRVPVVLCYLEGKSYAEAGQQLGCSRGTISTRLTRARELLRARLTRRGVALSAGSLVTWLCDRAASAGTADALVASTTKMFELVTGHGVTHTVLALTEGVLKAMILSKIKTVATTLLLLAVFGVGAGFCLVAGSGGQANATSPTPPSSEPIIEDEPAHAAQPKAEDKQPELVVFSPVDGSIVEFMVKVGDKVGASDILVRLDDAEQKLNLERARVLVDAAMADVKVASATAKEAALRQDRAKKLYAMKSLPEEDLGLATLTASRAQAEVGVKEQAVRLAESDLQRAEFGLKRYVLRAPANGVVKSVLKGKGENVRAGEAVLQIVVDPSVSQPRQEPAPLAKNTGDKSWANKLFLGPMSHDFGDVPRGSKLVHRFELKNVYKTTLELIQDRSEFVEGRPATIGCLSTPQLGPGETGSIRLFLEPGDRPGPIKVRVHVRFGNDYTTTAVLHLSAMVIDRPTEKELMKDKRSLAAELEWNQLGVRLEGVAPVTWPSTKVDLPGGLRVLAVRPSSPAAAAGLRDGDILVSLHQWATPIRDHVTFALGHAHGAALRSIPFIAIRDDQIIRAEITLPPP